MGVRFRECDCLVRSPRSGEIIVFSQIEIAVVGLFTLAWRN